MSSLSRNALILMALLLAAATAATAATAFAADRDSAAETARVVASAVHTSSDAARRAVILTLTPNRVTASAGFKALR